MIRGSPARSAGAHHGREAPGESCLALTASERGDMARYYIDIGGAGRHSFDCGGQELLDLRAVRKEAIGVLLEISRDALGDCDQGDLVAGGGGGGGWGGSRGGGRF